MLSAPTLSLQHSLWVIIISHSYLCHSFTNHLGAVWLFTMIPEKKPGATPISRECCLRIGPHTCLGCRIVQMCKCILPYIFLYYLYFHHHWFPLKNYILMSSNILNNMWDICVCACVKQCIYAFVFTVCVCVCMCMVGLCVHVCTGETDRQTKDREGGDGDKRGRWGHRVKTGALRRHHMAESPEELDKSFRWATEGSGSLSSATHHY